MKLVNRFIECSRHVQFACMMIKHHLHVPVNFTLIKVADKVVGPQDSDDDGSSTWRGG